MKKPRRKDDDTMRLDSTSGGCAAGTGTDDRGTIHEHGPNHRLTPPFTMCRTVFLHNQSRGIMFRSREDY